MLKLRILLLRNVLYYLLLFFAFVYFVFFFIFSKTESIYINDHTLKCTITNIVKKDYGVKLELKNKEKIIGYYYTKKIQSFIENYSLGDKVLVKFDDKIISNNTIENTFNYKKYLQNNKIYKVVQINEIQKISNNKNIFYKIKNFLLKRSFVLTKSYPYINSLLFGNNNDITNDVLTSYRDNGVSHLFAISGSHISMFILILEFILKKVKIKETIRYIVIIIFLLFYMFLTNFSMSILRASIFTILSIINKIFYFYIKPINLGILTLVIMIFINPLSLFNLGFQYSYLISMVLIYMSDYIASKKNYVLKLLLISLISFIVSIPITISNFYELNFLSVFYNMFFVPYVSFIIIPVTLFVYIFPFGDNILYLLTMFMEKLSLFLGNIRLGKFIFYKPSVLIIIVYFVSIFVALYFLKRKKKRYFIFLLVILFINNIWPLKSKDYLTYIDVNQGDAIFLNVNKMSTLIDTGGNVLSNNDNYTYYLSKNGILPYLKSKGIKKLDNLVLTHGDADHMRESLYIIRHFKIKNIYFNSNEINYLEQKAINVAKEKKINIYFLKNDDVISLNDVKIYSLNKNYDNENDSSIVLYTKINNYKLLFLGDISKKVELNLLNEYNLKDLDMIKLAHHGSNTSSDFNFLKETNPKKAIISVGINNSFNHPSDEVINNLKKLNISYFMTSEMGSITFDFNKGTFLFNPP